MRGRRPRPATLRLIEGGTPRRGGVSHRAKPQTPQPSAPPDARLPKHLVWLAPEAKALWKRLAPEMMRQGLLTDLDLESFAMACSSWATWRRCQELLMRQGETYTTQRGAVRARPEVKIARDAEGSFARWAAAFGFTPADRARIQVAPPSFHWDDEF